MDTQGKLRNGRYLGITIVLLIHRIVNFYTHLHKFKIKMKALNNRLGIPTALGRINIIASFFYSIYYACIINLSIFGNPQVNL